MSPFCITITKCLRQGHIIKKKRERVCYLAHSFGGDDLGRSPKGHRIARDRKYAYACVSVHWSPSLK